MSTEDATTLAAKIRSKEIGSRELLEGFVDRIERLNPPINAVVTLDLDRAYTAADVADAATARGESFGPLHGLPTTIKDAIATEGIRSTGGAIELTDPRSSADRSTVAEACVVKSAIRIPMLIDDLDNAVASAYGGWTDRPYLIGRDGRVAFQGEPGPFWLHPRTTDGGHRGGNEPRRSDVRQTCPVFHGCLAAG